MHNKSQKLKNLSDLSYNILLTFRKKQFLLVFLQGKKDKRMITWIF